MLRETQRYFIYRREADPSDFFVIRSVSSLSVFCCLEHFTNIIFYIFVTEFFTASSFHFL